MICVWAWMVKDMCVGRVLRDVCVGGVLRDVCVCGVLRDVCVGVECEGHVCGRGM